MVRIVDREGNPTDKVCSMKAARYYHRKIMETIGDERYDLFLMRFVYQIAIDVKKDDKHATELLKTRANSKLFRSLSFAWLFVIAGIWVSPVYLPYRIIYSIIVIIILAGIIWRYKRFSRNYAEKLYAFHYYRHKAEIDASDISEISNVKAVDSADGTNQLQQPASPNTAEETRHNVRHGNSGNKSERNNKTDDMNSTEQKEQTVKENQQEQKEQTTTENSTEQKEQTVKENQQEQKEQTTTENSTEQKEQTVKENQQEQKEQASETKQEAQQGKKKLVQPGESTATESQTTSELPEDAQSAGDLKQITPLSDIGDDFNSSGDDD